MEDKIKYGLISVSLLALLGSGLYISDAQLDKMWYCDKTGNIYAFERMSSTNKTGYWTEDGVQKQKTCTLSHWIPLREYCKTQGVLCEFQDAQEPVSVDTGKYYCDINTCDKLD